jgi:hypothetical protein
MNAPLPESIRKALESVTLDDNPRSGLRRRLTSAQRKLCRSHKYAAHGAAGRRGFGVERLPSAEV